jgi:hypothetical protein
VNRTGSVRTTAAVSRSATRETRVSTANRDRQRMRALPPTAITHGLPSNHLYSPVTGNMASTGSSGINSIPSEPRKGVLRNLRKTRFNHPEIPLAISHRSSPLVMVMSTREESSIFIAKVQSPNFGPPLTPQGADSLPPAGFPRHCHSPPQYFDHPAHSQ